MRYLATLVVGWAALLYGQCNQCTPDASQSPLPYGFRPDPLQLPPGIDTSLVIYFTFPDTARASGNLVTPNYAIWVDSLRLDVGLITEQDGSPFAYDVSNPSAGPMHFDQLHRYKQWRTNPVQYANFIVYQNPGGTAGRTPPIGCARVCIRTSSTVGSDTLRVKVRVFVTSLTDAANKDTTNLMPVLLGQPAYLDTVFRYAIVISNAPASLPSVQGVLSHLRVVPNPAYGEATLKYEVLKPTELTLRVYSVDGREVFVQHLGMQVPGSHEEILRLSAGYYHVVLQTPAGATSTRLTVVE